MTYKKKQLQQCSAIITLASWSSRSS